MGAAAGGRSKYRRRYKRRVPFRRRMAKKLFASKVKRVIKNSYAERKYVQFVDDSQVVSQNIQFLKNVCEIAQGDSQGHRTGNRVEWNSINLRWTGWADSTIPQEQSFIMCAIVVDLRQVNTTDPTFAQIWDNGGLSSDENVMLNMTNRGRFKVLYHEVVPVSAYGTGPVCRDIYLRPRKLSSWYTASGATNIDKNGIYLMFSSNRSSVSNPPYVSYHCRCTYTDV